MKILRPFRPISISYQEYRRWTYIFITSSMWKSLNSIFLFTHYLWSLQHDLKMQFLRCNFFDAIVINTWIDRTGRLDWSYDANIELYWNYMDLLYAIWSTMWKDTGVWYERLCRISCCFEYEVFFYGGISIFVFRIQRVLIVSLEMFTTWNVIL